MEQFDLGRDLKSFKVKLERTRDTALHNFPLGMAQRDRLVERLVLYLRQYVSNEEAEKVTALTDGWTDPFKDQINAIDDAIVFIEALLEDVAAGHIPPRIPLRTPGPMQRELARLQLHPRVVEVAGQLFTDGHYRQAILDTYIALVETVKQKSGLPVDNTPLMEQAFSPRSPRLRLSTDPDEQQGYMRLFSGAVLAIRNPKAHQLIQQRNPGHALEWLCLASALFRLLDQARMGPTSSSP